MAVITTHLPRNVSADQPTVNHIKRFLDSIRGLFLPAAVLPAEEINYWREVAAAQALRIQRFVTQFDGRRLEPDERAVWTTWYNREDHFPFSKMEMGLLGLTEIPDEIFELAERPEVQEVFDKVVLRYRSTFDGPNDKGTRGALIGIRLGADRHNPNLTEHYLIAHWVKDGEEPLTPRALWEQQWMFHKSAVAREQTWNIAGNTLFLLVAVLVGFAVYGFFKEDAPTLVFVGMYSFIVLGLWFIFCAGTSWKILVGNGLEGKRLRKFEQTVSKPPTSAETII